MSNQDKQQDTRSGIRNRSDPHAATDRPEPTDGLICIADVKPERIDWFWKDRLPFGKLTLIDGDPGIGKTTLALDLAARLSRGAYLPCEKYDVPVGNTLILSAEDGVADTIRPRLEVAGADLTRIHFLDSVSTWIGDEKTGRWEAHQPTLPDDIGEIRRHIEERQIRYVIIDPLMAYISGKVNAHNDQDIRRALAPLSRMAQETGAAVVVLRHLNKMQGTSAIYRGGGSIGIIGAARSALLVARHPEEDHKFVIVRNKCNLSRSCESLCYSLDEVDGYDVARVKWLGVVPYKADHLLMPPKQTRQTGDKEQQALDFYLKVLSDHQEHPSSEIDAMREAAGISQSTANRVRKRMGVKSWQVRTEGALQWFIRLPKAADTDGDDQQEESESQECHEEGTSESLDNLDNLGTVEPDSERKTHVQEGTQNANNAKIIKISQGTLSLALF